MRRKKSTPKTRVLVNFIQDRSGSMEPRWAETVSGFKLFIEDLRAKKEDIEYLVSLVLFNTSVEIPIKAVPIELVSSDYLGRFSTGGGTALYDALGQAIHAAEKEEREADKVLYVVVTDGEENSSRTWTKEALHAVIDSKLNAGKTTFTYLGAQPETWDDAGAIGIGVGSTVRFDASNIGATYAVVTDAVDKFSKDATLRSTKSMTLSYADKDLIRAANMTTRNDPTDRP